MYLSDIPVEEEAFFAHMRTCRDAYRRLGDCIHNVLGAHSAIDFGCGVGDCTERLEELGWRVLGAEYSPVARRLANCKTRFHDLRSHPLDERYEVAICTETAEHIDEEWADSIVENVATVATKWIVWSAAQPGQEWPGHVNLQPTRYWLDRFMKHNWIMSGLTEQLRMRMVVTEAQHWHASGNFFCLRPA